MTVSQVLAAASARLTPETWTQQMSPEKYRAGKECPHFAIDASVFADSFPACVRLRRDAIALFAEVVSGRPSIGGIWLWNDRAGRTLQDVHAAFDAAIAIAHSQEQPVREEEPCSV